MTGDYDPEEGRNEKGTQSGPGSSRNMIDCGVSVSERQRWSPPMTGVREKSNKTKSKYLFIFHLLIVFFLACFFEEVTAQVFC